MTQWHSMTGTQVLKELDGDLHRGLTGAEAARRLRHYGPNQLEEARGKSLAARFFGQMRDPMILVLLAAARTGWTR